jgi:hypothetical protein
MTSSCRLLCPTTHPPPIHHSSFTFTIHLHPPGQRNEQGFPSLVTTLPLPVQLEPLPTPNSAHYTSAKQSIITFLHISNLRTLDLALLHPADPLHPPHFQQKGGRNSIINIITIITIISSPRGSNSFLAACLCCSHWNCHHSTNSKASASDKIYSRCILAEPNPSQSNLTNLNKSMSY